MLAFHVMFPEIALDEIRTMTVPAGGVEGLPPGAYSLMEFYCTDPKCDCRRVIIRVLRDDPPGEVATISHAFLPLDKRDADLGQTFLDPINPQSRFSPILLELFREVALTPDYEARLKRHYRMVKDAIDDPAHPIHERIAVHDPEASPRRPPGIPRPRRRGKWKKGW